MAKLVVQARKRRTKGRVDIVLCILQQEKKQVQVNMNAFHLTAGQLRRKLNRSIRHRSGKGTQACDVSVEKVRPFKDIPGPGGVYNIPLIGAMFHFKPFTDHTTWTVHRLFSDLLETYGSLVRVRLGEWTVLIEDPADMEIVRRCEGKYPKRRLYPIHSLYCEHSGFKKGLAHLQGKEWYNFRSPVNPRLMRVNSAQHYLPIQNEVGDDLVILLQQETAQPEEMLDLLYRYACESIGVVTYDRRLGYLSPNIDDYPEKLQVLADIKAVLELVSDNQHVPEFITRYLPLKEKRVYKTVADRLVSNAQDYYEKAMEDINSRVNEGTSNPEENNFMLSLIMTDKMSVGDMVAISMDLFIAGTDSTARNLQMILYNMAVNPDKQQKLYEQILSVLGPSGPLTGDALSKMPYMSACLKESFRLTFPIVSGTQRYLPEDIILQGHRIPKGTSLIMMNQETAKNEKYFPAPESYLPERWLRDSEGKRATPIPPSALLPFGFGPRQCLGKRFAEQEIYLAVTKIIQKFEVSLEPGQNEIEIHYRPFVGTKEPIRFKFKERKS
ncbi:probable cytochrome P450 12e1, mitochondrial [Haliotis cracherodii]|uniref:probable cytochrome P450 12e1, mitochondrial n=1 Tax=Haliotis cracherodii TaxID=6455 RepID=UPI0039ED5F51